MTTTTIHTFFKNNLANAFQGAIQVALVTILVISMLPTNTLAETRAEYTVNSNESKTIFVYVKYGSDTSITNITNVAASAVINNPTDSNIKPSFIFDKNANQDVFYGDPANQNDTPLSPRECESFVSSAPQNVRYQIPSSFITDTKINNYGLQTAKNGAQDKATLVKGRTGCLVLALKIAPGAKVDDRAQLIVNLDANSSNDYNSDSRPETVTVPLKIIAPSNISVANISSTPIVASKISTSTILSSSSSLAVTPQTSTTRSGGYNGLIGIATIAFVLVSFLSLRKLNGSKIKIK